MKKLTLGTAIAIAALTLCGAAQAVDVVTTFNVTATLTSKCEATSTGTPVIAFGAYTAFQTTAVGPVPVTPALTFRCTRGMPQPTAAFDGAGAVGVIPGANLHYTLSAPVGNKSTTGAAATTAAADIGTPDVYSYKFDGTLLANQAGNNAGNAVTSTDIRTLTITY
jgi:hypothetical protein